MRLETLRLMLLALTVGLSALTSAGQDARSRARPGEDEAAYRFRPMPLPKALVRHRGNARILVDGALAEWPKVMPLSLRDPRQVSGTALGAYRGANDISGQLYLTWDEQYLFVALQVLDEWHRPLKKDSPLRQEIPPIDNAQITFDPKRNTRGFGDDSGRQDDRTFYFADIEEIGDKLIHWDRRKAQKDLTPGAQCIVDRREKEGLTIYEARIPWREILPPGEAARDRRVIDLQVVLNDYDEITDPLPQTRVGWNFGMGPQIKPGLWGSVMLVKDLDERQRMPDFDPPPEGRSTTPGRKYWVDLYDQLAATQPRFCTVDTPDPGLAGGEQRYQLLRDLDGFLQQFRRLDNLEFHHRIQRRMLRETAGITQTGLPFFWDYAMKDVLRRAVAAPGAGVIRLFRLPQGGFYVRSDTANFVIDAAGLSIEHLYLGGGVDFAILTRPTEVTRRHDPLLIRMSASKVKRPFYTHLEFHLPGAEPGSMFMCKPFADYVIGGVKRVTPIGEVRKDGKVTLSVGYLVEWADGRTLVHAGLSMTQALIKKLGIAPDVLILSGMYGDTTATLARDFGAQHTILDDTLIAEEYPSYYGGRLSYSRALKLQNAMKPQRTLILAPGESIDLRRR